MVVDANGRRPRYDDPRGTDRMRALYESTWEAIAEPHTPEIAHHLAAEVAFVAGRLAERQPSVLVEIGCADGRLLLDTALAHGVRYAGFDHSCSAIRAARRRALASGAPPDRHLFRCADVEDAAFADALPSWASAGPTLVVLPFNVVGGLRDPWRPVGALAGTVAAVAVLAFATGDAVREARLRYYRGCGLIGEICSDDLGDTFSAGEFRSTAYHPAVVRAALEDLGVTVTAEPLGGLGVAYVAERGQGR